MSDLTRPVQDAFYAALDKPEMKALSPVYQHVPENTQPPVTIVGDIAVDPIAGKDGGLDRMTVEIVTYYRGPKRAKLYEMQGQVRSLLEGVPLPAQAGAAISVPAYLGGGDELLEDGLTYEGVQRFEVIAQPA